LVLTTGVLTTLGLWLQLFQLKHLLTADSLMPAFDRHAVQSLFNFGIFSWMQAVAGVVFSQVDRLMLGVSLGAGVVASYSLSAQMAQPIFGFTASGLHFLFPFLAHRSASSNSASLKLPLLGAFVCNLLFVALSTGALLLFGHRILVALAGTTVAQGAEPVLTMLVWSCALLGLNVTATYALLALGRVQIVTWFNLAGGLVMLLLILVLTPRIGVRGIAIARLSYALIPLLLYIPLLRHLLREPPTGETLSGQERIGGAVEVPS
jgi:O-antigen/teichoic acid export membrane protein